MIRNNFLTRFIVVTLTTALLLMMGSRAIPVSALADPVPITAVYDTQIIQLADYVDSLPQPSVDIFYILCGVLAAAQLGGQEYKLEDPYATSSDVVDWFKSMGIRLYNTVIGLAPNQDPILGFDVRPYIKPLAAAMMGNAVLSRNYGSVQEFIESEDDVLVPFQRDIQQSINVLWQLQGGPYHWQFDTDPFAYDAVYRTGYMSITDQAYYNSILNSAPLPHVRVNDTNTSITDQIYFDITSDTTYGTAYMFRDYHNLFIDSNLNRIYLCNDAGTKLITTGNGRQTKYIRLSSSGNVDSQTTFITMYYSGNYYITNIPFDLANFDNKYVNLVRAYFNNQFTLGNKIFFQDFITHCYVGTTWLNKQEIFNVSDLNISEDGNDYYFQSPTTDDYLIDIKNLINDLVNKTDIWDVLIDNFYDDDGIKINIPVFGRISVSLDEIVERLAPPIPVDLNDIAELTDNSYLERVKEHARNAGDIFANYVAFWHNCDADLVYTLFGAGILVLVGAFIGKWGHS